MAALFVDECYRDHTFEKISPLTFSIMSVSLPQEFAIVDGVTKDPMLRSSSSERAR